MTIAPANADITVVSEVPPLPEPPAEGEKPAPTPPPVILVDAIPGAERSEVHFLLDNDDETRWALDESLKDPLESEPWEPNWEMISEEERAEGFVPLFDGKTLNGWWARSGDPAGYHVSEDGFIEWLAKGTGGMSSRERYDNFTLRLEWKILPGGNSGVWLHAPRAARSSKVGMEYQIMGDRDTENPDKSNTAAVYDVLPPLAMPAYKEGLWNEMEATFNGPYYKAYLNGVLVQDVNFEDHPELIHRLRNGFIVLTDHSDYVAYRNIRVKRL